MATTAPTSRLARAVGIAAGLALAALLVLSWRLPEPSGALGADARFVAVPPGELQVRRGADFLSGRGLEPGGRPARGRLELTNISGKEVAVGLRGLPSNRELDRRLRVELRSGGRTLFAGSLAGFRKGSRRLLRVPSGARRAVEARAWLPRSARGWEARSVDVTVDLTVRVQR